MFVCFYDTEIGRIAIAEKNGKITNIFYPNAFVNDNFKHMETPILQEAIKQIRLYLSGHLKEFTVPLEPQGTPFMQKVWLSLCEIPYGKTASYKDIAVRIGNPRACRAVGMANNRNPIPIIIPCHRVIGANGALVGYGGGLELKKKLLDIEKDL